MTEDLSRRIEEELRKEEQPQQAPQPPQQAQPQLPPVREVKPSIGRAEVEVAMEQARRYEEDLRRWGYGEEPPLFATSLLERIPPEQLAKLLGEEGSDISRTVITLWMLEELSMSRFMKWMMFQDWLDSRRSRAQPQRGESDVVSVVRELVNAVVSRSSDVNTLKELASIVKDIASVASGERSGVPEELVRKLEEVAESVREGRKSPREALQEVKEMVGLVREVAEALRPSYGPSGTTTVAPLSYSGSAPWILHPDARQALKDVVDMVVDSVAKIALALRGVAPPLPMGRGSGSSVPKELLRGG